jgi:hypothetical protein
MGECVHGSQQTVTTESQQTVSVKPQESPEAVAPGSAFTPDSQVAIKKQSRGGPEAFNWQSHQAVKVIDASPLAADCPVSPKS